MKLNAWWDQFGEELTDPEDLDSDLARELVCRVTSSSITGIAIVSIRQSAATGYSGVYMNVEVERPQELAYPIRAVEPIAVVFPFDGGCPSVLSLREDFPDTPHQNWVPPDIPRSLCIDDRPWQEARLTATGFDLLRRIQVWLSKTSRGELHDRAQPPEPLFLNSSRIIMLPASAVLESSEPTELVGFVREDNPFFLFTLEADTVDKLPNVTVVTIQAQVQGQERIRHVPNSLSSLATELERCGINLYDELKTRLTNWAGIQDSEIRRLSTRLAIVITFSLVTERQDPVNDVRAFVTDQSAGEIGVALGVLHTNNSDVGDRRAYIAAIPAGELIDQELRIDSAQVHFGVSREIAAMLSGRKKPDCRRTVLVGAGSLGSQLSLNLAREGSFAWTVVDCDILLPHNTVRHALHVCDIGAQKANALAREISSVLDEEVESISCNLLHPANGSHDRLKKAFGDAEIIIDTSASVAVSRHLSDLSAVHARRICAFFNPAGTSVVLMVENANRSITIRDLEAQYYRHLICDLRLSCHLETKGPGVRYSGSCRSLTNQIPASNTALLSALISQAITRALDTVDASVSIWTLKDNGEVQLVSFDGTPVIRTRSDEWKIVYDEELVSNIMAVRSEKLPNETGGVLLGVTDINASSIHIVHALTQPEDSLGTPSGFERGVFDLRDQVSKAMTTTMDQVRYVGEWHSHPEGALATPSRTDIEQLNWLKSEMEIEGLKGLIAIAAGDGAFSLVTS